PGALAARGTRPAPRTRAAPHRLAALDRNRYPPAPLHAVVAREQLRRAHDPEPAVLELAHGGLVSLVGDHHSRSRGEEVAGARPLLALLQRAVVAPAEDRLERLIHGLHRREEIRDLLDTFRLLATVQDRQPLRPHEMRRAAAAQLPC